MQSATKLRICETCGYRIDSKVCCNHQTILAADSDNSFKCNLCGSLFTRLDSLRTHKKSFHENLKFLCDLCDHGATRKQYLRNHMKYVHGNQGINKPNVQNFNCIKCDTNFTRKGSLKRHIESIHDKIEFPCQYCDYHATKLVNLNRHIKSLHTSNKLSEFDQPENGQTRFKWTKERSGLLCRIMFDGDMKTAKQIVKERNNAKR